jgi:hypothetical protein
VNQETPAKAASTEGQKSPTITILTILVALLLLLNLVQFGMTFQQNRLAAARAASHEERAQAAQALVEQQSSAITSLMRDYESAAYNNPSVERITEQQLLAAEATIGALQIIALQNSQIIQLLATAP